MQRGQLLARSRLFGGGSGTVMGAGHADSHRSSCQLGVVEVRVGRLYGWLRSDHGVVVYDKQCAVCWRSMGLTIACD